MPENTEFDTKELQEQMDTISTNVDDVPSTMQDQEEQWYIDHATNFDTPEYEVGDEIEDD
jgi:hypothetical protein